MTLPTPCWLPPGPGDNTKPGPHSNPYFVRKTDVARLGQYQCLRNFLF
jgi:hypothetical protein